MTNKKYIKQATDDELIALMIHLESHSVIPKMYACDRAGFVGGCYACEQNHICYRKWLESEVE